MRQLNLFSWAKAYERVQAMAKEDLDSATINRFIDQNEADYHQYLVDLFDSADAREQYAISFSGEYLQFKYGEVEND